MVGALSITAKSRQFCLDSTVDIDAATQRGPIGAVGRDAPGIAERSPTLGIPRVPAAQGKEDLPAGRVQRARHVDVALDRLVVAGARVVGVGLGRLAGTDLHHTARTAGNAFHQHLNFATAFFFAKRAGGNYPGVIENQ